MVKSRNCLSVAELIDIVADESSLERINGELESLNDTGESFDCRTLLAFSFIILFARRFDFFMTSPCENKIFKLIEFINFYFYSTYFCWC